MQNFAHHFFSYCRDTVKKDGFIVFCVTFVTPTYSYCYYIILNVYVPWSCTYAYSKNMFSSLFKYIKPLLLHIKLFIVVMLTFNKKNLFDYCFLPTTLGFYIIACLGVYLCIPVHNILRILLPYFYDVSPPWQAPPTKIPKLINPSSITICYYFLKWSWAPIKKLLCQRISLTQKAIGG